MAIRKFWIENANGDKVFLTEQYTKVFFNNPTGLGYSQSYESVQYGDVIKGFSSQNFVSIGGEVVFFDERNKNKYEKYNEFVAFLSHTPLILFYQIPTTPVQTYNITVSVASMDKTEVKRDGLLRCALTMQTLSRWRGQQKTLTGTSSSYTIVNDGHMPVGFEITINGTLSNPYFTLEQDGEIYGEAKFNDGTAFEQVYVDSNDGEQNVILEQGGVILPNPLSYQDLSISNGSIYVTFVKLARGTTTLEIGMDSGSITGVEIKYTPIYRSI